MKDLFSSQPDLPSPINSQGGSKTASGSFNLTRPLKRKKCDTMVAAPPKETGGGGLYRKGEVTDSVDRYFGSFSIESKRHVWDLLSKHPLFGSDADSGVRSGRITNNTRDILLNDPLKTVQNGGKITYQ